MTETGAGLGFNPVDMLADPALRADPYPLYAGLRSANPRLQLFGVTVLTRYDDCSAVLRHPSASSDMRNSDEYQRFVASDAPRPFGEVLERLRPFLILDPPDHTRLRGLVAKTFTPRVIEGLRPRIAEIVNELLDRAAEAGSMELIEDLAYPLPVRIISEMLGVPPADNAVFRTWSRALAGALEPDIVPGNDDIAALQVQRQAFLDFAEYFRSLFAELRKRPGDDLLSALIAAEDQGDTLTEDELLATCILLLVAGHETTVNLIGNAVLALLRNPDELSALRTDASLLRGTIEEVLRYDPPVQLTIRTALDDIALDATDGFGAAVVKQGEQAVLLLGAANRDPAHFREPERFDVRRDDNRHLAFGAGIHFCLGAPLARAEAQVAIGALFSRFANVDADTVAPAYKTNVVIRGLAELPLTLA